MDDPLPELSYHEASLLAPLLIGFIQPNRSLADFGYPPAESVDDELNRMSPLMVETRARDVRDAVASFLRELEDLDLSSRWDVDKKALAQKLTALSERQNVRLYLTLKRYFWDCGKYDSEAETLGRAGFFPTERIALARQIELTDQKLDRLLRSIKHSPAS